MLDMYAKCGNLRDAQTLFDEMDERDVCSYNTMISGYTKRGFLELARTLFDEMPQIDNFSWTAMISGCISYNQPIEALNLYRRVQNFENSVSNKFTLSSVLSAVSAIQCLRLGKEIHGYIANWVRFR